jgi:hypothetical protein
MPVGKQRRLSQPCRVQPAPCPVGTSSESFELLHGPSDDVFVDARRDGVQLGAVEGPVVVDPASHLGVDLPGEAGQVRSTATVEVPGRSSTASSKGPKPDLTRYRSIPSGLRRRDQYDECGHCGWARRVSRCQQRRPWPTDCAPPTHRGRPLARDCRGRFVG